MMLQMMKRDYYISKTYLLMTLILIPFVYILNISPLFMVVFMIVGAIFNLFYYDHHNHTNRFIISLPVNRNQIVLSRYLFIGIIIGILIPYLWGIDYLMHSFIYPMLGDSLPTLNYQQLEAILLLLTLIFSIIIVAVSLPIYYFFQSVIKSVIAQVVLFILSIIMYVILVLNIDLIPEIIVVTLVHMIDFQPVIFVSVFIAICVTISLLVSTRFFATRDIE